MSFWAELRRRHVFKAGVAYIAVAWLIVQAVSALNDPLRLPDWLDTVIVVLLAVGLPVTLVFAWAYDLTPQGLQRSAADSVTDQVPAPKHRRLSLPISVLFAVVLAVALVKAYLLPSADALDTLVDVSQPVPGFSNRAAIAVLPFSNLSDDAAQEYFSDGVTDDIITGLYSIGRFPIIARTSTFAFKDKVADVRDIAESLGAGYILGGSVRKTQNRVRITAQLVGADGRNVWADSYDAEYDNVFSVQDEIAHQIIGAIEPQLLQAETDQANRVRPQDMEAWDYYLQASADLTTFSAYADRYGQPITLERTEHARELVRKALALDPTFADAYTLLAHVNYTIAVTLRHEVGDEAAARAYENAERLAKRGIELNPFGATACSCYVAIVSFAGDNASVVRLQEEAVRINPASAIARVVLAKVYSGLGRYREGLREIQVAKRLSPRDVDLSWFLSVEGAVRLGLGDWQAAADVAQNAIFLTPLNHDAHAIRIAALYALGRKDDAKAAAAELAQDIPNFSLDLLWDEPLSESLTPIVAPLLETQVQARFSDAVGAILVDIGKEL